MRATIIGLAACALPLWASFAVGQQQNVQSQDQQGAQSLRDTPSQNQRGTAAQQGGQAQQGGAPQRRAARAAEQAGQTQAGDLPSAEELLRVPVTGLQVGGAPKPPRIDNPYANDQAAVERGSRLFDAMNCSGCHAPLGGGGMGPPLSDSSWVYGSSPADVFLSIQQGRPNGMPSWGHIGDEAIWTLVAYVRSLDQRVTAMQKDGGPATATTQGTDDGSRDAGSKPSSSNAR